MIITVTAYRCPRCGDDIYSRARRDFRVCSCGAIFVDGGLDPAGIRYGFLEGKCGEIYVHDVEVEADRAGLYDDWNRGMDRYGKITAETRHHISADNKERSSNGSRANERQQAV